MKNWGNEQQPIMAMLERQMGAVAVPALAAQPFAEEAFLRLALIREIAPKERPQRGVGFDPVIEPVDQRIDGGAADDTGEEIAAGQGAMSLAMSQESTVLHTLPTSDIYWVWTLTRCEFNTSRFDALNFMNAPCL